MSRDTAVTTTLEIESYFVSAGQTSADSTMGHEEEQATIAAMDPIMKLIRMVDRLLEKVEALQLESARERHPLVEGSCNHHPNRTRIRLSKV